MRFLSSASAKEALLVTAELVWKDSYQVAMLETDDLKLPQRLQTAKGAIHTRIDELLMDHGGTPEERQAIADALGGLNVLRRQLQIRSHETGGRTGAGKMRVLLEALR